MISYEVSFGLCVVCLLLPVGNYQLVSILSEQFVGGNTIGPLLIIGLLFVLTGVAETNRSPFDLSEGESELVSGFNVEFPGMAFALFFLAEYASIFLFSFLIVLAFGSSLLSIYNGAEFIIKSLIVVLIFI